MCDDCSYEIVVRRAEILEVDRLIYLLEQDGELALEDVSHKVLLEIVHHKGHVVTKLTYKRVATETIRDKLTTCP